MTGMEWEVHDEVKKGDDLGEVVETIGTQPISFRLVVDWDGGGQTVEIGNALAITGEQRDAKEVQRLNPTYMPGGRVRHGVKRSAGTVTRSWFDEQAKCWKYDVDMDDDHRTVTATESSLRLGTLPAPEAEDAHR